VVGEVRIFFLQLPVDRLIGQVFFVAHHVDRGDPALVAGGEELPDHPVVGSLARSGSPENDQAAVALPDVVHAIEGVLAREFLADVDPVSLVFEEEPRGEAGRGLPITADDQDDVKLEEVELLRFEKLAVRVHNGMGHRVGPPHQPADFLVVEFLFRNRVLVARLPVAQAQGGVLARFVFGNRKIGLHPEQGQRLMGLLDADERSVIMFFGQFLDAGFVEHSFPPWFEASNPFKSLIDKAIFDKSTPD
jgi:hypothetical protein